MWTGIKSLDPCREISKFITTENVNVTFIEFDFQIARLTLVSVKFSKYKRLIRKFMQYLKAEKIFVVLSPSKLNKVNLNKGQPKRKALMINQ